MAIDIYLNFKGNTREAVLFYADVFGTQPDNLLTFGDVPQDPNHPLPEEARDWIMHARINIHGSTVMFSDVLPNMQFSQGNNITLSLGFTDLQTFNNTFDRLKEGGEVGMEPQETFWSKRYGNLTDRFGIGWQFNFNEE
ncbi:VOC family protein [Paenibacillus sp. NPDC058071]|uniref:VOC family protein n=1 Tax=Paenibacillus sp. NPDC058071 TaxID=3346326 RepID=UPI0036D7F55F